MATATERGQLLRSTVQAGGGLLNQQQVSVLIGRNKSTTNFIVDREDFPKPIAEAGARTRLWLHEEVVKWTHKHPKQGGVGAADYGTPGGDGDGSAATAAR